MTRSRASHPEPDPGSHVDGFSSVLTRGSSEVWSGFYATGALCARLRTEIAYIPTFCSVALPVTLSSPRHAWSHFHFLSLARVNEECSWRNAIFSAYPSVAANAHHNHRSIRIHQANDDLESPPKQLARGPRRGVARRPRRCRRRRSADGNVFVAHRRLGGFDRPGPAGRQGCRRVSLTISCSSCVRFAHCFGGVFLWRCRSCDCNVMSVGRSGSELILAVRR